MTPREGKGQCQKRKRADGTGRGYGVEVVGSWGCRRRGRCPQTKIGESQVPGSPGRSLPHAPRPGPSASSLHPSGAPHTPGSCCCAPWRRPWSTKSPSVPTRTGRSPVAAVISIGDGGARLREASLKGCHPALAGQSKSAHSVKPNLVEHSCHDTSHKSSLLESPLSRQAESDVGGEPWKVAPKFEETSR